MMDRRHRDLIGNESKRVYFNPLLDYLLKPNIYHQLHHAVNKGYLLFVPYHHVSKAPARQRVDTDEYNRVFKTSFTF